MATATPKSTPDPTEPDPAEKAAAARGGRIEAQQAEQDKLDELDAARTRLAELEKELGVTASGGHSGGGLRGDVQALLRERVGYQRRDLPERVAQVDEQLRIRGYRVGRNLDKDTAEAFEAAAPGVPVEDVQSAREAQQTTR